MLLETAQIILSDKSNHILKKSPDTCAMVIIFIGQESYATEIGKVIKETVKKYH